MDTNIVQTFQNVGDFEGFSLVLKHFVHLLPKCIDFLKSTRFLNQDFSTTSKYNLEFFED